MGNQLQTEFAKLAYIALIMNDDVKQALVNLANDGLKNDEVKQALAKWANNGLGKDEVEKALAYATDRIESMKREKGSAQANNLPRRVRQLENRLKASTFTDQDGSQCPQCGHDRWYFACNVTRAFNGEGACHGCGYNKIYPYPGLNS